MGKPPTGRYLQSLLPLQSHCVWRRDIGAKMTPVLLSTLGLVVCAWCHWVQFLNEGVVRCVTEEYYDTKVILKLAGGDSFYVLFNLLIGLVSELVPLHFISTSLARPSHPFIHLLFTSISLLLCA